MTRNPLALAGIGLAGIFVTILVGIMVAVAADDPRPGRFRTDFHLIDHMGKAVDQTMFHGHPSLVYFGYTNCPEACPTTLFEMADWLKTLGEEGKSLKAYFFTIDPERDTPDVMKGYVEAFTDRITGITGEPAEMQRVADGWMIHATKESNTAGGYHMSHTLSLLLIGADGRLKGMIPYGTDRETAIERIRSALLKPAPAA
jgi:protein SCO1/2